MFSDIDTVFIAQDQDIDFCLDINVNERSIDCKVLNNYHVQDFLIQSSSGNVVEYNINGNNDLSIIFQDSDGSIYKMKDVLLSRHNCPRDQNKASFTFTTKKDSDAVIFSVNTDDNSVFKAMSNYKLLQTLSNRNDVLENIKVEIMGNDRLEDVTKIETKELNECNIQHRQCMGHVKSIYELYENSEIGEDLFEYCQKELLNCIETNKLPVKTF
jgi:hypothetical protein